MAILNARVSTSFLKLALCLFLPVQMRAQDLDAEEYQVKAAFLFNFAQFVEWPPETFAQTDQINICIVGNKNFSSLVEKAVAGKQVAGHGFAVQTLLQTTAAKPDGPGCHILFVGKTEQKRAAAILHDFHDPYVLTVGEFDNFLALGGVLNLRLKDAHVRIEINPDAAAHLKSRISSKLLKLAEPKR